MLGYNFESWFLSFLLEERFFKIPKHPDPLDPIHKMALKRSSLPLETFAYACAFELTFKKAAGQVAGEQEPSSPTLKKGD